MAGLIFSLLLGIGIVQGPSMRTGTHVSPPKPVAVVFGAGLAPHQQPSVVLKDRLDTAYDLYVKHLVSEVFVSGDSTSQYHDEVGVMSAYLVKKGLPQNLIKTDENGIDTYSTCLHAKDLGAKQFILVTQSFHMPRAKYLCEGVGLSIAEAVADKREYDPANAERESQAMAKAWLQLNTDLSPKALEDLERSVK